jgi:hypothetical protein
MTTLYVYFKQLDPHDGVSLGFDLGLRVLQKDHNYNHVVVSVGPHIIEQTFEGPVLHSFEDFNFSSYPLCLHVECADSEDIVLDRATTLFALNLNLTPQDLILWSLGYRPTSALFCTDLVLLLLGEAERQYLTPCELLQYLREEYKTREFCYTPTLSRVR